jgi:hypothetical protein
VPFFSDGLLRVYDTDQNLLGTERLRPDADAGAAARRVLREKKGARGILEPIPALIMPHKDKERRRAYHNALRAKQRRAAGVPLQSDPDAIDKQQPWLELNISRWWWRKKFRWLPENRDRWQHRQKG